MHTSSSAWAFELAQLESDVRSRLGELAPPRIRFAPGPLPEPETTPGVAPHRDPPRPTASDRAEAAGLAARIGDETLRDLVARAASASLAAARDNRAV